MKFQSILRFCLLLAPVVLGAQGLDPTTIGRPLGTSDDWPVYGGDYSGKRFSALKQIDRATVKNLGLRSMGISICWSRPARPSIRSFCIEKEPQV
jgi:hypothetical protein